MAKDCTTNPLSPLYFSVKFTFQKHKYGQELLVDCEKFSDVQPFITTQRPFYVSFHEIFFITEGSGIFKLDDEIIPFKRGTILLLPPHKWRQWSAIHSDFDGYFLIFEEEFINNYFNDPFFLYRFHFFYNRATPSFVQINEHNFQDYLLKLNEIKNELGKLREDSNHFLRSLLYYLLITINRTYEECFSLQEDHFQDILALRFKKLLEKNITTTSKVSEYAELLQVSRSHLNKTIKKHYGKSCSEIIKERLVAEVKKALLFSDKTISEIAYQLNFSEPGNLIRLFKKVVKMTPKEFRLLNTP